MGRQALGRQLLDHPHVVWPVYGNALAAWLLIQLKRQLPAQLNTALLLLLLLIHSRKSDARLQPQLTQLPLLQRQMLPPSSATAVVVVQMARWPRRNPAAHGVSL